MDNQYVKKLGPLIIIGVVLCLVGIIFISSQNKDKKNIEANTNQTVSQENKLSLNKTDLAQYDGINKECYVAIKDKVYKVNNQKWQNGIHTPTNGKITCGQDWTSEISKSPHGSSVLNRLEVVGSYNP